jgi:hypothetical protein
VDHTKDAGPHPVVTSQNIMQKDVPAHEQDETIHLRRQYPTHEIRADDPYKELFEQTRARLKRQGLYRCIINNGDCKGEPTIHHDEVEFAYANSVDIPELDKLLGLTLNDDDFQKFVDEPGNLEVLCVNHHLPQGDVPIHLIPAADWTIIRVHKGATAPVVVVH